jgi:2-keto-4-pentenoate hydratase
VARSLARDRAGSLVILPSRSSASRWAALLLQARAGGPLVDAASEPGPADLEEMYRVQDLVLHAIANGERPGAWKAIPPRPGTEAAASPVPARHVVASPAKLAAGRQLLGVEAEIAFRLGADLQPQEALVLIELCETRLADWVGASLLWKLADFQSNAALIIGTGTRAWRKIDFAAQTVELLINGRREKQTVGTHPSRDPSRLIPWMVRHCAARGGLQLGDIIATGSWVGIVKVRPGDEIAARFPGIGEARLSLAAI